MSNNPNCTILSDNYEKVRYISPHMNEKTFRASMLMLLDAILIGVVVIIGAYAPRYRRHPLIGVVFMGATASFLPIVSIIVTTTDSVHDLMHYALEEVLCHDVTHLCLVFLWAGVVVVIGINTSAVAAADAREGRSIAPPKILFVKASWSAYLTFSTLQQLETDIGLIVQLFAIMFAKLLFKYASFYTAQRSFAFGRSPRLIAGYMAQLQQQQQQLVHDEHTAAPPSPSPTCPALVVIGEDTVQVEQQPQGCSLKQMPNQQGDTARADNRLMTMVTLDRVWGLDDTDIVILQTSTARPRDLCFSFALFKLLRCRFAKYTVSEAGFIRTSKFFRETLLRGDNYERVFGIITDELSLINDYYYSSLPIHYSHPLLPALGVTLSIWSMCYCLYLVLNLRQQPSIYSYPPGQIHCWLTLITEGCHDVDRFYELITFGSWYFDAVPLFLAIAVLVLAETRDILFYISSNWTKVALICHHVNQACWQRSPVVQRCICSLLKHRGCKLLKNWDDKMKQCSVLVLRPRNETPLLLLDRRKKVKVPSNVKAAIFEALKGESFITTEQQGDGATSCIRPPSSPVPLSPYGCSGRQSAGYTILVWHIATSVFEARKPPQPSESDDKTVATHLSRYCAYLMTSRPELLPDDAEWCRKLYDLVKKDADRVLAKVQGGEDLLYVHNLIEELSADDSNHHEVLRNGAKLGKELLKDSAMGWKKLASFWAQMILYVAPSENLEAHAEAISHGGELITLLWAMLAHAGITGRLDAPGMVAAAAEEEGVC